MWVLGYLCFIIKEFNLVLYCLLVVGWDGNSSFSEGLGWADSWIWYGGLLWLLSLDVSICITLFLNVLWDELYGTSKDGWYVVTWKEVYFVLFNGELVECVVWLHIHCGLPQSLCMGVLGEFLVLMTVWVNFPRGFHPWWFLLGCNCVGNSVQDFHLLFLSGA